MLTRPRTIALAWTGASGIAYGMRLLEVLLASGTRVFLMTSQVAHVVARQEMNLPLPTRPQELHAMLAERFNIATGQLQVFGREEWFAPVASGSNPPDAMAICPCTMGTLAAVAHGLSKNLLERAADVMLKERRTLILVPRETPFSVLHLENMLALARAGATILPANPGFYHEPKDIGGVVDFVVARVLDHLGVAHSLVARWGATDATPH